MKNEQIETVDEDFINSMRTGFDCSFICAFMEN